MYQKNVSLEFLDVIQKILFEMKLIQESRCERLGYGKSLRIEYMFLVYDLVIFENNFFYEFFCYMRECICFFIYVNLRFCF